LTGSDPLDISKLLLSMIDSDWNQWGISARNLSSDMPNT
jgi:hypothetical protein